MFCCDNRVSFVLLFVVILCVVCSCVCVLRFNAMSISSAVVCIQFVFFFLVCVVVFVCSVFFLCFVVVLLFVCLFCHALCFTGFFVCFIVVVRVGMVFLLFYSGLFVFFVLVVFSLFCCCCCCLFVCFAMRFVKI